MASAFERHASSLCENAVPAAVRKVEQKAERHPNDEPFPGDGTALSQREEACPSKAKAMVLIRSDTQIISMI